MSLVELLPPINPANVVRRKTMVSVPITPDQVIPKKKFVQTAPIVGKSRPPKTLIPIGYTRPILSQPMRDLVSDRAYLG